MKKHFIQVQLKWKKSCPEVYGQINKQNHHTNNMANKKFNRAREITTKTTLSSQTDHNTEMPREQPTNGSAAGRRSVSASGG